MSDPPEKKEEENGKRKSSPLAEGAATKRGKDLWSLLDKVCAGFLNNLAVTRDIKVALKELREIMERKKEMFDRGTQVNAYEIREDSEAELIARLIMEAKEKSEVKELMERKWPETVYKRTRKSATNTDESEIVAQILLELPTRDGLGHATLPMDNCHQKCPWQRTVHRLY